MTVKRDIFTFAPASARRRALLAQADAAGHEVRLTVLRDSDANRFYARFGFVETGREGVDIFYRRAAR